MEIELIRDRVKKNNAIVKNGKAYAYASFGVFILSLIAPAFTVNSLNETSIFLGIKAFFFGAVGLLGGGFFEWLIWMANLFFIMSVRTGLKGKTNATIYCILALCIGASFSFWKQVLIAENGRMGNIQSLDVGYFTWLMSMIVWLVGLIVNKPNKMAND